MSPSDRPPSPPAEQPPSDDGRWDEALLAAGFEVDPDSRLSGRPATELADDPDDLDDPWRDAAPDAPGLTDEQRAYVEAANPTFGAALPAQTLTGDDPLGDVHDESVRHADDEVIDFD